MNPLDLYELAESVFLEATEAHLDVEDNRDDIHTHFDRLIDEAIGTGHIEVTGQVVKRITREHLWQRVNAHAGQRGAAHLRTLVKGQPTLFECDEILDRVITAGAARRTTIRHLNRSDMGRMVDERQANFAKQALAFAEFRDEIAPTVLGWLNAYGSIPKAIEAGVVELVDEAVS